MGWGAFDSLNNNRWHKSHLDMLANAAGAEACPWQGAAAAGPSDAPTEGHSSGDSLTLEVTLCAFWTQEGFCRIGSTAVRTSASKHLYDTEYIAAAAEQKRMPVIHNI